MSEQKIDEKICWILAAAVLLTMAALYSYDWACALSAPLAIDYEGPNLWIIDKLSHGRNIYNPDTLRSSPWAVTIYTPIFFAIGAILQQLFGFNYWCGRLISIFACIASTIAAYRIFRLTANSRLVSTVSLAVLVTYLAYWTWSFYARVDMLALAFSLLSIERFLSSEAREKQHSGGITRATALSILLGVAAVFTKQPSILVPLAISLYYVLDRRFKEALIYGGASVGLCLVVVLCLNAATAGGFIEHMRYASHMPFSFEQMYDHVFWIGHDLLKIMVLPLVGLSWFIGRKRIADKMIWLPLILTLLTATVTLYTLGTVYPNTNHAFLLFFALTWLGAHLSRPQPVLSSLVLMMPALISCGLAVWITWVKPIMFNDAEMAAIKSASARLAEMQMPGALIFAEDPAFVLQMNATPLFVDVATFVQVWQNERPERFNTLIDDLSQKRYAAVLMNKNDAELKEPLYYWQRSLIEAVHKNYDRKGEVMGNRQPTVIYLPKGPATGP